MKDIAIEDIIDNGIEDVEAEIVPGSGRKSLAHKIRISRARLFESFQKNPTLLQAAVSISNGYELREKGFGYALIGYKKPNLTGVRGGRDLTQEAIDRIRDLLGHLHRWEMDTEPRWTKTVEAIEFRNQTANQYSRYTGIPVKQVMQCYRNGLNAYAIIRGWGDQIYS